VVYYSTMQSLSRFPHFILVLLLVTAAASASHAQASCSLENLLGGWKEKISSPGVQTDIEGLKVAAAASDRNLGIWHFLPDNRYSYRHTFQRSKYKKKNVYLLDAQTCEIILGSKANARERANLEILYLDNNYLIYKSDNNPKGYFTHVLVRYKGKSRRD
jgi:hypothetical protein